MGLGVITARGLSFSREDGPVLADLDFAVHPGQVLCLLGPSGCGKSTLLRLVAGLLEGHTGTLKRQGRAGFVFQDARLLPWLSVRNNIALALRGNPEAPAHIDPLLERVGIGGAAALKPAQLSGGMAQRAALVRALVRNPEILLLDEPFSAVDPLLRETLQDLLDSLLAEHQSTTILLTHDISEAATLGDEILVLSERPARVVARIEATRPHPRPPGHRSTEAWMAIAAQIRRALSPSEPAQRS